MEGVGQRLEEGVDDRPGDPEQDLVDEVVAVVADPDGQVVDGQEQRLVLGPRLDRAVGEDHEQHA
jgi:hypothetical protein